MKDERTARRAEWGCSRKIAKQDFHGRRILVDIIEKLIIIKAAIKIYSSHWVYVLQYLFTWQEVHILVQVLPVGLPLLYLTLLWRFLFNSIRKPWMVILKCVCLQYFSPAFVTIHCRSNHRSLFSVRSPTSRKPIRKRKLTFDSRMNMHFMDLINCIRWFNCV